MDSRTGKKIRLGRLFNQESGKTLIVAFSHGVLLGPLPGMETLEEMRRNAEAMRSADAIMVSPGMVPKLEDAFVGKDRPALVVHLDWTNFSRKILPYDQGAQVSMATMEEIAVTGADAVMSYLLLGPEDPDREREEIERNARLQRACDRLGLLLMIEPRGAFERLKPDSKTDLDIMKLYCRISAEIGADLIKVIWSGSVETMQDIVVSTPAPVLVAGGAKQEDPAKTFQNAQDIMKSGASGLVFGRNIYQSADPAKTLARFRQIVHGAPGENRHTK